ATALMTMRSRHLMAFINIAAEVCDVHCFINLHRGHAQRRRVRYRFHCGGEPMIHRIVNTQCSSCHYIPAALTAVLPGRTIARGKVFRRLPSPAEVTPTTPLRLDVAARLAFPGNSVSASALRRLIVAGKLEASLIAGKYFVTLNSIEGMIKRCRVKPKDRDLNSSNTKTDQPHGLSATETEPLALDAMNMTAKLLKQNLRNTSSPNTTRQKPSAKVIRIPQK
ncbi:MAG TPA: hypothetical protein VGD96_13105, partial [Bradyrhizobium sp.]